MYIAHAAPNMTDRFITGAPYVHLYFSLLVQSVSDNVMNT